MFFGANRDYLIAVLVGLGFLLAGMAFPFVMKLGLRLYSLEDRHGSAMGIYGCVGVLVAAVGAALLLMTFAGASPWERTRIVSSVLAATPDDILSAEILPLDRAYRPNPIRRPLIIRDRKRLKELCDALNKAQAWWPNHPESVWLCQLRLHRVGADTSRCLVDKTKNNGVLLRFQASKPTFEWPIGPFRCDAVGALTETWAKEDERPIRQAKWTK